MSCGTLDLIAASSKLIAEFLWADAFFFGDSGYCGYFPPVVFGVSGAKLGPKNVRNFHFFTFLRAFAPVIRIYSLF